MNFNKICGEIQHISKVKDMLKEEREKVKTASDQYEQTMRVVLRQQLNQDLNLDQIQNFPNKFIDQIVDQIRAKLDLEPTLHQSLGFPIPGNQEPQPQIVVDSEQNEKIQKMKEISSQMKIEDIEAEEQILNDTEDGSVNDEQESDSKLNSLAKENYYNGCDTLTKL